MKPLPMITLSQTTKMPCPSYSLSAFKCQTGSRLAEVPGSVCSGCYARKGFYRMASVKRALERRYQEIQAPDWVDRMVQAIRPHAWFRWHDSGDLQSVAHLARIVEIARQTPGTRHWLPTKEPRYIKAYLKQHGAFPDNLTVRISAPMIGQRPVYPAGTVGSAVDYAEAQQCPAPSQGNQCRDCRACWSRDVAIVSYHKH